MEIGEEPGGIRVLAHQPAVAQQEGVGRADGARRGRELVQQGQDGLFVGDGHIQAVQFRADQAAHQPRQLRLAFGQGGHRVEAVFTGQAQRRQGGVVQQGRKAVAEGVAGEAEGVRGMVHLGCIDISMPGWVGEPGAAQPDCSRPPKRANTSKKSGKDSWVISAAPTVTGATDASPVTARAIARR